MSTMSILRVLICAFVFSSVANAATISEIRIIEYGLFEARVKKVNDAQGTSWGQKDIVDPDSLKNIKRTKTVPAAVGTRFGISYVVDGDPAGAKVRLSVKVIHPRTINPKTNQAGTLEQYAEFPEIGKPSHTGWTFDAAWEIAPGEWIVQLWAADRKLAEQSFTVKSAE